MPGLAFEIMIIIMSIRKILRNKKNICTRADILTNQRETNGLQQTY